MVWQFNGSVNLQERPSLVSLVQVLLALTIIRVIGTARIIEFASSVLLAPSQIPLVPTVLHTVKHSGLTGIIRPVTVTVRQSVTSVLPRYAIIRWVLSAGKREQDEIIRMLANTWPVMRVVEECAGIMTTILLAMTMRSSSYAQEHVKTFSLSPELKMDRLFS